MRTTTWYFRFQRVLGKTLDNLFPASMHYCVMCMRPMDANAVATRTEANGLDCVCAFCMQGAPNEPSSYLRNVSLLFSVSHSQLHVVCALRYDGFVQSAIRNWKYDGALSLTPWFVHCMYGAVSLHNDARFDFIVPVLTSVDRMRKRGFDQAYLLGQGLSKKLCIPCRPFLRRAQSQSGFTESQTTKFLSERSRGMHGGYAKLPRAASITGKRILLVDDVLTTGSTLRTCAELLYEHGACSVVGTTIAYVP